MNRDFKGVWISKEVWLDEKLTWMEKLLITEIDSLDNEEGCYASNSYFAEFFNLSTGRISQMISSMKEKGCISIEYERNGKGKEITKRVVRILNTGIKNPKRGIKDTKGGYLENDKGNNTVFNNTKEIKKEVKIPKKPINEEELKASFNEFRKAYPGTRRGLDTEYALLKKEHPKEFPSIIKRLSKDLEIQIAEKKREQKERGWTAQWKNLQTYIRNKAWEERIYDSGESEQDKMAIIKNMTDRDAGMLNERHLTKEERFNVDSFEKMGMIVKERAFNGGLPDFTIEKDKKIQL